MITIKLEDLSRGRKNSMTDKAQLQGDLSKAAVNRRRGMIFSVIVGSVIVHVVALMLFGLWTVARYWKQTESFLLVF